MTLQKHASSCAFSTEKIQFHFFAKAGLKSRALLYRKILTKIKTRHSVSELVGNFLKCKTYFCNDLLKYRIL
jgi:hypothetical protein